MYNVCDLVKFFLHVAKKEGADVTPSKLQKIFFLLEKEGGVDLGLGFVPWFFGCYSEALQDCVDFLADVGEIGYDYRGGVRDPITGAVVGYKYVYVLKTDDVVGGIDPKIEAFFREWVKKDRDEVITYVYKKYPEYFLLGYFGSGKGV